MANDINENEITIAQSPKTKKKTWILVLIAFIILVFCCLIITGLSIYIYLSQRNDAANEKLDEAVESYDEAWNKLSDFKNESYLDSSGLDFLDTNFVNKIDADIEKLQDIEEQFNQADSEFNEVIEFRGLDWEYDYAYFYIESIDQANKSLKEMIEILDDLKLISSDLKVLSQAEKSYNLGIDSLNQAVENGNKGEYSKQKAKSGEAKKNFEQSNEKYQQIRDKDPTYDLDSYVVNTSKAIELADLWIKAADAGAAGKLSTFNDYVKQFNNLKGELSLSLKSKFFDDPEAWFKNNYKNQTEAIDKYIDKAEKLRLKAEALKE